jgi:hypothetical protein
MAHKTKRDRQIEAKVRLEKSIEADRKVGRNTLSQEISLRDLNFKLNYNPNDISLSDIEGILDDIEKHSYKGNKTNPYVDEILNEILDDDERNNYYES